jgi:flagellar assembly protein FliH
MAVLRNGDALRLGSEAIVLDLGDLARQGEALRERARREAEEILAAARAERERLIVGAQKEGYARGFEEGRAEGLRQGLEEGRRQGLAERSAELASLEKAWTDAVTEFRSRREVLLREARDRLIWIALEIARRVTRRQYEHDPGAVVRELLDAALELAGRASHVVVCVNAEDESLARQAIPGTMKLLAAGAHVEVRSDPSLPRGSCVVRTDAGGEVDASIGTQLDRIARALLPGEES